MSCTKTFKGHLMGVTCLAYNQKKDILATGSDDTTWKLWTIPNGDLIMSGEGHSDWIGGISFNPKGNLLNDPSDPSIYNPIKPENRYQDLNNNGIQDANEPIITSQERRSYWFISPDEKYKISPRFGISFPISDKGVFHFSYGHFFQMPKFEYLYLNPDFDLSQSTGNTGVIGNADLNPEKTISAEIGVQQELNRNFVLNVTAYFRDIRELT